VLTPVEQLVRILVNIDGRLASIPQDVFLETLINLATDEGMLLQMFQTFDPKKCAEEELKAQELSRGNARITIEEIKVEEKPAPAMFNEAERKPINGVFYDVRIKTHYFGGQRQVVFVFTNVSAEKDLQRELTMKQFS
jgi:hypothetical protein